MKKEIKVFVLNLELIRPEDKENYGCWNNSQWIAEAERQENLNKKNCGVYTLRSFQRDINNDQLFLDDAYLRFIEVDSD